MMDEIGGTKKRRKYLETGIVASHKSADEFAERAETTRNLDFITKSNNLRRTAKEKSQELAVLRIKVDRKVQPLKD